MFAYDPSRHFDMFNAAYSPADTLTDTLSLSFDGPTSRRGIRRRPSWTAKIHVLPVFDRGTLQRIDAVRIALDDHRRGQHHRKRHACEDETHQSQAAAIHHRRHPLFLPGPLRN